MMRLITSQPTFEYGNGHNEARVADKAPSISYTLKTKYRSGERQR